MRRVLKIILLTTVILSLLISGISCGEQPTLLPESPSTPTPASPPEPASAEEVSPPPTPTTQAPKPELKSTPEESSMIVSVEEARKQYPNWMIEHNGFVYVISFIRSYYGAEHLIALIIMVNNDSEITLYTTPSYLTLIDSLGTAYGYDAGTYTYWGKNAFRGINLPPGTNTMGALNFRLNPSAKPEFLLYDDGITPPMLMDWRDNPDVKP